MGYAFDPLLCQHCPFGICITKEIKISRKTDKQTIKYINKQREAFLCTFNDFVPNFEDDDQRDMSFEVPFKQYQENLVQAGNTLFPGEFHANSNSYSKVGGYAYELLIGLVLWNVASVWNKYMDSGLWTSSLRCPEGLSPGVGQKIAIFKLPNAFDATTLFTSSARDEVDKLERRLAQNEMTLSLSAPDFVGVLIPTQSTHLFPEIEGANYAIFDKPIEVLDRTNVLLLEDAHNRLHGKLSGKELLFAIALKHSTRSDRLYQPLFEANVLKFYIQWILKEPSFKFYAYVGEDVTGDVDKHYRAASLVSLMENVTLQRAIDTLHRLTTSTNLAQFMLDDFARLFQKRREAESTIA